MVIAEIVATAVVLGTCGLLIWGGYRAGRAAERRQADYTVSTLRLGCKRYQQQAEQAREELARLQRALRDVNPQPIDPGWLR